MTRDEVYKELCHYSLVMLEDVVNETNEYVEAMDEIYGDLPDEVDYYTAMGCLSDILVHILDLQKGFDDLFWKMALTPNSDPQAQAEAEKAIAWRLESMRHRTQGIKDGTIELYNKDPD